MYKKTYQSFQVIAQTKLVSFAVLAALFLYNNLISIPKAITNSITPILAKDAIFKREQLCAYITHDYNSDVENICR